MILPEIILTNRLVLRPLKAGDAGAIFVLRSDENINRYVDRPKAKSIEDAVAFIEMIARHSSENNTLYRAITLKDNDELIGTITLWNFDKENNKAEIGYELLSRYQGNGYMHEAVKAMLDIAFGSLQLSCVEGWTHPVNRQSNKLLEKFGFTRDHEAEKTKPEDANEIIYSLKAADHS